MRATVITAENLPNLFDAIQDSSACHLKYSVSLKNALETQDNDALLDKFTECLHILVIRDYKSKNIYVNRVIKFLVTFCDCLKTKNQNNTNTEHPILLHIIRFMIKYSRFSHDPCRYWSCKIIKDIMANTEDLSEDLFIQIRDSLLDRLKDAKSAIRLEALSVLNHFQDPTDPEDPVINSMHNMINTDFYATIRQLCVEKIAITKQTLPSLLKRARDVDPNVRLTTFQRITPIPKLLTITERRIILQCGFLDSSDKIKNYINTVLLEEWLTNYEDDFFKLMKSIRLDACKDDIKKTTYLVEHMLNPLFKTRSIQQVANKIKLNNNQLMDYEDLNWESILYYRLAIEYLRKSESFDQVLNNTLPELVVFSKYIKGYVDHVKHQEEIDFLQRDFILEQFFLITAGYDVGDEASRQSLNSLLHYMLQNTTLDLEVASLIVKNLEKTIPDINNRSIFVCEIISNIMYGEDAIDYEQLHLQETERQQHISQVKSELMCLNDTESDCISQKQYLEAGEIRAEIENKMELLKNLETFQEKQQLTQRKTDVLTVGRYLTVAEAFLRSASVKQLNPALATLCEENILKNLTHEDISVKVQAFRCYALCCIVDLKTAKYGIHIFSAPILSGYLMNEFEIDILIVSIKAVVDLLSMYGLNLVDKSDEEDLSDSRGESERKVFVGGTSLADVIEGLANLLDHEDNDVQETTTRGICSLLVNNRITSPSLLSRIIIKWASPATDNDRIKQFIGHTLNLIPSRSNCLSYFSEVVITTIRTMVYAPSSSPLHEINVEQIAKFMLNLCQMTVEGSEIHTDIALKMCSQMIDKPKTKIVYTFSRVLLQLNISKNEETVSDLIQMCDQLRDIIRNNQISKNIIKFNAKLEEVLRAINEKKSRS